MSLFEDLAMCGWVAGIVDGEGSISANPGRTNGGWQIVLQVYNTDPRMIVRLKEVTGVGSIYKPRKRERNNLQMYEWKIASRQAVVVLEWILPYLVTKKPEAEIALAIAATIGKGHRVGWRRPLTAEILQERHDLRAQLKLLKHIRPTLEEVS